MSAISHTLAQFMGSTFELNFQRRWMIRTFTGHFYPSRGSVKLFFKELGVEIDIRAQSFDIPSTKYDFILGLSDYQVIHKNASSAEPTDHPENKQNLIFFFSKTVLSEILEEKDRVALLAEKSSKKIVKA